MTETVLANLKQLSAYSENDELLEISKRQLDALVAATELLVEEWLADMVQEKLPQSWFDRRENACYTLAPFTTGDTTEASECAKAEEKDA